MVKQVISIKPVLEIIFKILKKSSNYFADAYLFKDVSLVSKWKTGKVIPKNEDIKKVVEFANNESSEMQKHLIRIKVEEYINESLLEVSLKRMLINIEDFSTFLTETLIMSISDENILTVTDNDLLENENIENDVIIHSAETVNTDTIGNTASTDKAFDSNVFQRVCKFFSTLFQVKRTRIIAISILILCIAVLSIKFFTSYQSSGNVLRQTSLPNAKNSFQLSENYIMSYTHSKDSGDEVQTDINGNPITFNNLQAKVTDDDILYIPLGETLRGMGFTYISFNGTLVYKELSSGKTVSAKADTKKLIVDNVPMNLSEPILYKEYDNDVYVPAYFLKGFIPYIDKIIPQDLDIKIDKKLITEYDFKPRVVGDTLYLPFRQVFEMFGYKVDPDRRIKNGTQRAQAKKGSTVFTIEEGKEFVTVNNDKQPIQLKGVCFMSGNVTYVSADVIKQALKYEYNWNKDNETLDITTTK